jgi:hypothetical protein
MKPGPFLIGTVAILWASGCGQGTDGERAQPQPAPAHPSSRPSLAAPRLTDSDALIREKGTAVVQEAFSLLSSNLLAALAAGGPSNAIPFCSVQALPLTESVSDHYSVDLRRVSDRVRNPKNAATPHEADVLDGFAAQVAAGQQPAPLVVRTNDTAWFYAPILINNPLCLTCHGQPGQDMTPETTELLKRLYPEDRATGFRMNDLRGMWVVRIHPGGETR